MKDFWQVLLSLVSTAVMFVLVFGSLFVVFVESGMPVTHVLTSILSTPGSILVFLTPSSGELAELGSGFANLITATFPPPPANCPPPEGWVATIFKPGDTLSSLADTFNTTKESLIEANCLLIDAVLPGTILYVPKPLVIPTATFTYTSTATNTFTPTPSIVHKKPTEKQCIPPAGWVIYIVKRGDTLYSIGMMFGVSWTVLQQANCMGSSTIIHPGQALYVPNVPPRIPTNTLTSTVSLPTNTPMPTNTPGLVPSNTPTLIPSETLEPTTTDTPVPTATATPEPSATHTPEPTNTSQPVDTNTPTIEPTSTPEPEQEKKP